MSIHTSIFSPEYKREPFWWEAFKPCESDDLPVDKHIDVAVIGGGYAGTCCALTLANAGARPVVFEAGALGQGASTRSGGQVSGGVNVQKKALASGVEDEQQREARLVARLRDAAASMTYIEHLIDDYKINCGWHKTGRMTAMWIPAHYEAWKSRLAPLNEHTQAGARMLPPEALAGEIGSSIYHGAALIERGGHLHPALLYAGMLEAARGAGARFLSHAGVKSIERSSGGYLLKTSKGDFRAEKVVIATNGYTSSLTPDLKRQVLPIASHMIATEELAPDLARSILPTNRAVSESRRVVNHYRLSPDGKRLIFGGRARFTPASEDKTARLLYRAMLKRFPQLEGVRITHSWGGKVAMTFDSMPHIGGADGLYYALGCNGSGVAMMSYLGHSVARKILAQSTQPINAFDNTVMPRHPLYFGSTWFLFAVGSWYQFLDAQEKRQASPR
ncbi:FAD-binding oxidoreductase [Pusillimonas sp. T7-7]|uniref:NAD(P)/FAD-dependent oxidoreductase n=1 Tax=Pusillimonas sp. (strain T7-7) TaxID=1007105 RepID=UPI001D177E7F|nr:FAD-binding oxidoreductase [Pusillimonas sp. T7-7]